MGSDGPNLFLIIPYVIFLLLSAFFSASETAYSSINTIRLKNMAEDGNKKAKTALALANNYDKFISSVLIGNNIVNIASSSLATVLFVSAFGNAGVTISTAVTTVLVLLFGEISPKTLAKESPEQFAMLAAPVLKVWLVLLTPINALFAQWKKLILKMFKIKGDHSISEQELLTYVGEARETGGINEAEEDMIRSVIEFDDLQAIDIYTPRVDVQAVALQSNHEDIAAMFYETGFSRLPVYDGSIDHIVGVLLEKDFHYLVKQLGQSVKDAIRPILFIPKSVKISNLLTQLQQKKIHMAVIIDDFGGTMGIVTIEDIVEEIVGEIWDEHDDIEEDITSLENGGYKVLGGTSLDDMFDEFGIQNNAASLTVGGWVVEELGHIPKPGESFEADGLCVTVLEMLRNRVGSVQIKQLPPPTPADENP